MKSASTALVLALIVGSLVAWRLQNQRSQDSAASKARIPEFPMKALASPGATHASFFVSRDGTITRYAVHVGPEGLPEWIPRMADEKIGKGEDLAYEVELYPDGSEVFEIYRKVGGREKQLSVHADRKIKYLGTQVEEKDLPENVGASLRGVKGFVMSKGILKEGPGFAEYHFSGRMGDTPHRVRLSGDGRLLSVQRKVAAEVEVAVQE